MTASGPSSLTWVFDGSNWSKLSTPVSPSPRYLASFAPISHSSSSEDGRLAGQDQGGSSTKDSHGEDLVLFGGRSSTGALFDTWIFDGHTWKQATPKSSPPPLYGASFTYDRALHQDLLFGGMTASGPSSSTWLFDGENWSAPIPGALPPEAPGLLKAAPGDNSATLTWSPPSNNGGAPVIGYVVVGSPGIKAVVLNSCDPARSALLNGLVNGTTYYFFVYAITEAGISAGSVASNGVVPFGPPGAPTSLSLSASDGSITADWKAPFDNGSAISAYMIVANPGTDSLTVRGSPPLTTGSLFDLNDGSTYSVTVTAINAAGPGPTSLASSITIPQGIPQPPGTPSHVAAYPALNAATLTWSNPKDNGSAISSYKISATPLTQSGATSTTAPTTAPSSTSTSSSSGSTKEAFSKSPVSTSPTTTTGPTSPSLLPRSTCLYYWESSCVIPLGLSPASATPPDPPSSWHYTYTSVTPDTIIYTGTCPTQSRCIAVGGEQLGSMGYVPVIWVSNDSGSTWSEQVLTAPSPGALLDSVSCPSPTSCIALGGSSIGGAGGIAVGFWTNNAGASWSSSSIPSGVSSLDSISCISSSTCLGTGGGSSASGPEIPALLKTTDAGQSFVEIPTPITQPGILTAIACPDQTTCIGIGTVGQTTGNTGVPVALVTTDGGTTWVLHGIATNTATGSVQEMTFISCPSVSQCITGGDAFTRSSNATTLSAVAYLTGTTGSTWMKANLASEPSGQVDILYGGSCSSATTCLISGETITPGPLNPGGILDVSALVETSSDGGSTWANEVPPSPAPDEISIATGVSCQEGRACLLFGGTLDLLSGQFFGTVASRTTSTCSKPPVLYSATGPPPPNAVPLTYTVTTSQPLSSFVISGLLSGVSYEITVTAANASGTGCSGSDPKPLILRAGSDCPSCQTLSYHGGPIQQMPRVFLILWGIDSQPLETLANAAAESNLFPDLAGSGYLHLLHQYGVTGYRGLQGIYYDRQGPSGNIVSNNQQIANEIHNAVMNSTCNRTHTKNCWHGAKPIPEQGVANGGWEDTQFVVIPDQGAKLSAVLDTQQGIACAYHWHKSPALNPNATYVYDLVPDPYSNNGRGTIGCHPVNNSTSISFGGRNVYGEQSTNLTEFTSHEFAEAATDPVSSAWYSSNGDEIGDACAQSTANPPSYLPGGSRAVVQLLYDNSTQSCRGEPVGGYWQASANGGVFSFGNAQFYGSLGTSPPVAPITGMAATPDGEGYWLVGSDGGVFAFGNAHFYGSLPEEGIHPNGIIVGIAATPDGRGYWLLGSDGGVFTFGDAQYFGSASGLLSPGAIATGIAATPDGGGYWVVDNLGNVHPFGDIGVSLNGNVSDLGFYPCCAVGIAGLADAKGYWIPGAYGAVYPLGTAPARMGSLSQEVHGSLNCYFGECVRSMSASYEDRGYYLNEGSGGLFPFGHVTWYGNAGWNCYEVPVSKGLGQYFSCMIHPSNQPLVSMAISP
ncbi:MAG: fibronectin type III domain-containing protein [Actinobacteria bacterium]|nr:fibronectin type III domain-containing protein [Actinomycetota bacterium]MCL5445268.1 fibronectin type III domain-containing protein [Actinomycetota bacterium]